MSLNKVILVGHLGADPEMSFTTGGQPKTELRMATSRAYRDAQGELREQTEWHDVVVWGKQAEVVLIVASGAGAKGGTEKWGHFAPCRWEHQDQERHEVMIGGEGLKRGDRRGVLHEAAHGLAAARQQADTSRQGRYHNPPLPGDRHRARAPGRGDGAARLGADRADGAGLPALRAAAARARARPGAVAARGAGPPSKGGVCGVCDAEFVAGV